MIPFYLLMFGLPVAIIASAVIPALCWKGTSRRRIIAGPLIFTDNNLVGQFIHPETGEH